MQRIKPSLIEFPKYTEETRTIHQPPPPFFSIIIPTFNRGELLIKAINSVLNQTFKNWELLIIDDGSTDNTKEIVSKYIERDNRINYIYQTNSERSAARNNGIQKSKGKYICFLDSDDYFLEDRLELLQEYLISNTEISLFYTGLSIEKNGSIIYSSPPPNPYFNPFDAILNSMIHCQQVCIPQSILKTHLFNPCFSIGEDMELWLRIVNEYPLKYIENQNTIVVLDHSDRSINNKNVSSALSMLNMIQYALSPPHPGSKASQMEKRKIVSNIYFNIAKHYLHNKKRWLSIKFLIFSILKHPNHPQTKHKIYLVGNAIISINKNPYTEL